MINQYHSKTVVTFGHKTVQIHRKKIQGLACIGFAEGGVVEPVEPTVILSFCDHKTIDVVAELLRSLKDFIWVDPNEMELELL